MAKTNSIEVQINAQDNTKKAVSSARKGFLGLNKDVTGLAKKLGVFGVGAVAAVGAFAYSAVKSAGEAQVALAKVDATLRTMGDAALKNKDAILQASEAAVKLGFDDEAAAVSIANLYQRTGDLTKAMNLNNLAMDLARAKSIDLESASNLVGQVLSGNQRALKQFGIEIDDTLGPIAALGELQKKVAGQAEGFASTLPGQMLVLQESWSNLKDIIGGALIEALSPFIKQFTDWITKPENVETIKAIAQGFGEFATVTIPIVIEAFKSMTEAIKPFYDIWVKIGEAIYKALEWLQEFNSKVGAKVKNSAFSKSGLGKWLIGGSGSGGAVNDAVIDPSGKIVSTAPDDWLIATKNPRAAMAGGGGVVVNIYNPALLSEDMVDKVGQQIIRILKRDTRY